MIRLYAAIVAACGHILDALTLRAPHRGIGMSGRWS